MQVFLTQTAPILAVGLYLACDLVVKIVCICGLLVTQHCRWGLRNARRVLVGNWKGRDRLENLGEDGRILLKCVLNRMGSYKLDFSGSGYGKMVGRCEYGNKRCDKK